MTTILRRLAIAAALLTERFILSFVFFCLAWFEINKIRNIWAMHLDSQTSPFVRATQHLILFLVACFTTVLLLVGRRAAVPPQSLRLIFIPLITTFFPLFYFVIQWLPPSFHVNLCPSVLQIPLTVAGLALNIIGPMVALWGMLYLGRSFGVFVAVRKVVLRGPYRWVRHPIYLGWVCCVIGVGLANFSSAYLLILSVHLLLIVYRAHLEETQLSEFSPEYRCYMKRAGFLFPKFRHPLAGDEQ